MSFKNKVVLITGSGSGIGKATAILFAKEGADIVIVDYNEDTAIQTGEECKQYGNRVLVIKADISSDEEAQTAINQTIEKLGKLDILVNNAGIVRKGTLVGGNIMNGYDEVMNTNLRAVVHMTSLAMPYLKETKGCIVNISSIASTEWRTALVYPSYVLSKVGLDSFTRLSALELAPFGIRVNAVNPGPVHTDILKNGGMDGTFDDYVNSTALGRCSDPEEIADLIMFLASDKAKSITGSAYIIDNGIALHEHQHHNTSQ